ncbi:tyrosine-type recombinase/integrase [Hellea balneolensis]|uniref:tyrosine-type recombinase/integrase n=1 Tax=Hellea balneolensis TaxID=287478 RepID=UPI00040CB4F2|nr:site-specific integrase [Hellea balneolensis]
MTKLTKRIVDALETTGKDHIIWDSQLSGFGIRISPKGRKTFVVQYRHHGKSKKVRLGKYGLVTVDQARKEAQTILGALASGKNPSIAVQRHVKSPTLNTVANRFLDEYVSVRLKPGTQANYRQILKCYVLPVLGKRKIIDIERADVAALHLSLKHVPNQANRCVLVLSKIFNLCEEWGLREQSQNPCKHVQRYKENKRHRFLSKSELTHLWQTLDKVALENTASIYAVNAYKLLILTGCRLSEIQTLQWSFIHGNHVEFPDSKTGYKRLPLNDAAMTVLAQFPRLPDNEYVICGEKAGSHIVNLQKSWRRIRKQANLDDVRIHDLRHTFASHAVMGGTPLALVSRLLGHSKITTTMRYAHLADAELAKASNGIGNQLIDI